MRAWIANLAPLELDRDRLAQALELRDDTVDLPWTPEWATATARREHADELAQLLLDTHPPGAPLLFASNFVWRERRGGRRYFMLSRKDLAPGGATTLKGRKPTLALVGESPIWVQHLPRAFRAKAVRAPAGRRLIVADIDQAFPPQAACEPKWRRRWPASTSWGSCSPRWTEGEGWRTWVSQSDRARIASCRRRPSVALSRYTRPGWTRSIGDVRMYTPRGGRHALDLSSRFSLDLLDRLGR